MRGEEMRRFWDRRAAENPLYFVDNRLEYSDPDTELFWVEGRRALDQVLDVAGVSVSPQDDVLEIGCGVGRLTREIAARGRSVQAIDVSERMLELAREHNPDLPNARWLLGDGVSLRPVADASVDLCLSHVVFQHIPDPRITLGYVREMGRVLRSGGRAAFQVSNLPSVHVEKGLIGRAADSLRALLRRGPRGQGHPAWRGSAVDLGDLEAAARDGGMALENVAGRGTQFCIVTLIKV